MHKGHCHVKTGKSLLQIVAKFFVLFCMLTLIKATDNCIGLKSLNDYEFDLFRHFSSMHLGSWWSSDIQKFKFLPHILKHTTLWKSIVCCSSPRQNSPVHIHLSDRQQEWEREKVRQSWSEVSKCVKVWTDGDTMTWMRGGKSRAERERETVQSMYCTVYHYCMRCLFLLSLCL